MDQSSLYFSVAEASTEVKSSESNEKQLTNDRHANTDIEDKRKARSKDKCSYDISHLLCTVIALLNLSLF